MKRRSLLPVVIASLGAAGITVAVVIVAKGAPAELPPLPKGGPVAPALLRLLQQINLRWPNRNRAYDGTLGDEAHQARKSDHNSGDALDVTLDNANGPDLEALAKALLRDKRVQYVIFRSRIANNDIQAAEWRKYSGPNPHDKHLHVSIRKELRSDETPWKLG